MACVLRTGGVWEGLLWSGQAGSGSKLSGQEQLLFGVEGWVGECCSEQDVCGVEGQAGSGMLQAPDWQMCSEDWGRPGGLVESQVEEVIGIQVGKSLRGEGLFWEWLSPTDRREWGEKVSGGPSLTDGQPLQGARQEQLWPKSHFAMAA